MTFDLPRLARAETHIRPAPILFIVVASLVMAAGCAPSMSAPSTASFAGTWVGSVNPTGAATGRLQLTLTQSGSQLTGTWVITFPNASQNSSGTVSGGVTNGSTMSADLQSGGIPTSCPSTVSGTLNATATEVTGTFASVLCGGGFSTSISLSKQ